MKRPLTALLLAAPLFVGCGPTANEDLGEDVEGTSAALVEEEDVALKPGDLPRSKCVTRTIAGGDSAKVCLKVTSPRPGAFDGVGSIDANVGLVPGHNPNVRVFVDALRFDTTPPSPRRSGSGVDHVAVRTGPWVVRCLPRVPATALVMDYHIIWADGRTTITRNFRLPVCGPSPVATD